MTTLGEHQESVKAWHAAASYDHDVEVQRECLEGLLAAYELVNDSEGIIKVLKVLSEVKKENLPRLVKLLVDNGDLLEAIKYQH